MKKNQWIYWRWKKDGTYKTFSKSKIQDIVKVTNGDVLLELNGQSVYEGCDF